MDDISDLDFAENGSLALPFENIEAVSLEQDTAQVEMEQEEPYCISLSSSDNNSNCSNNKVQEGHVSLSNETCTERTDFSNLDFSKHAKDDNDDFISPTGTFNALSHEDTASVTLNDFESNDHDTEAHLKMSNLKISDIQIRTVPEDEDLFNIDNFPSTPVDSLQQDVSGNPTPFDSGNEEEEGESGDSDDEYTSSDSEGWETASSDAPVIKEDLATLARGTYPTKKPLGRPKTNLAPAKKQSQASLNRLQERLEESQKITDRWLKDLETPENLSFNLPVKIPVFELNQYLTCGLCFGYLYEASTITECMHTFCKNCIVRHCMEISLHCPTCSVLIHPTDPFVNIRLDRMIQDIVDKLLPQVPEEELRRIKEFYKAHPDAAPKEIKPYLLAKPKMKTPLKRSMLGLKTTGQLISVVLEHDGGEIEGQPVLVKKYLRVTGSATIHHMSTYLRNQLHLSQTAEVDIFCCGDTIEEKDLTLLSIREKFFGGDECLMLLQYRVQTT